MRRTVSLAILTALSVGAQAWPTSLNLIPIADIVRHREGFGMYSIAGSNQDPRYIHGNSLTLGLFDRIEFGYDNDFLGNTTYNAKLLLIDKPKQAPDLQFSVGFTSGTFDHDYREPYAVGSYSFKDFRVHAGYWRTGGVSRGFFGADFAVGCPDLSAMVETLTGPNGYTYLGLCYNIPAVPGLSLSVSFGLPTEKSDPTIRAAYLIYYFKF